MPLSGTPDEPRVILLRIKLLPNHGIPYIINETG